MKQSLHTRFSIGLKITHFIILMLISHYVFLQSENAYEGITFNVAPEKTMKLTFLNQLWIRHTATNPGSTINNEPAPNVSDIGLRRTRLSLFGKPLDRTYLFVQAGMNNFSFLSDREAGFFFHDVVADYELLKDHIRLGGGLTAWGGFSRFSSPSVGSILGVDAPLFAQATNGTTDQFLRKLSVYATGNINKLHYRVAVSKPMNILQSALFEPIGPNATFSTLPSQPQLHGYLEYNFLEKEKHNTPYTAGTYLGKKNVLNLGAGFLYQADGMHRLDNSSDTLYNDIMLLAIDVFYDHPLANGGAVNFYGGYFDYGFGKGYLRNIGAMNPVNGSNSPDIVNGGGAAFPSIGTGQIGYLQGGYLLPANEEKKDRPRLMLYGAMMYANYDRLQDHMLYIDTGINLFLNGHHSKLTLAYQNRPVFEFNDQDKGDVISRKGLGVLQFQLSI